MVKKNPYLHGKTQPSVHMAISCVESDWDWVCLGNTQISRVFCQWLKLPRCQNPNAHNINNCNPPGSSLSVASLGKGHSWQKEKSRTRTVHLICVVLFWGPRGHGQYFCALRNLHEGIPTSICLISSLIVQFLSWCSVLPPFPCQGSLFWPLGTCFPLLCLCQCPPPKTPQFYWTMGDNGLGHTAHPVSLSHCFGESVWVSLFHKIFLLDGERKFSEDFRTSSLDTLVIRPQYLNGSLGFWSPNTRIPRTKKLGNLTQKIKNVFLFWHIFLLSLKNFFWSGYHFWGSFPNS